MMEMGISYSTLFAPCAEGDHSDCIGFSDGLRRDGQRTTCSCDCHQNDPASNDCACSLHRLPPKERAELFDRAIDATTAEGRQFADVLTIRAAIFDVIDRGDQDDQPWAFYEHDHGGTKGLQAFPWTEDMANSERMNFVDTVAKRIIELQSPPFNYIKLEDLCDRHRSEALPAKRASVCVRCEAEKGKR